MNKLQRLHQTSLTAFGWRAPFQPLYDRIRNMTRYQAWADGYRTGHAQAQEIRVLLLAYCPDCGATARVTVNDDGTSHVEPATVQHRTACQQKAGG